jgi:hypothetical protein
MVLWIDAREGTYGLQAEAGYLEQDGKAVEFAVEEDMVMEVSAPMLNTGMNQRGREGFSGTGASARAGQLPGLRFAPDGLLPETNPEFVQFRETRSAQQSTLWVALTPNRLGYEIVDHQPVYARR